MRRRQSYRVCRCTPTDGVVHLETRLLRQLVNREIHPIRCACSCRRKAQIALRMGDLCAQTGHPLWAMKIWRMARRQIAYKDYDDWHYVWFNFNYVRLADVVSEEECLTLGRRIDDLWRKLGHSEMAWEEASAEADYDFLWLEKYDYDRSECRELDSIF